MKIRNRLLIIIGFFGISMMLIFGFIFYSQNNRMITEKKTEVLEEISRELSYHLQSHLLEQAKIATTLSSAPVIRDALLISNSNYALLSEEERKLEIDSLNKQWKNTSDINDPFIHAHLTNPIAEFLKEQQNNFPEMYGEIFITNRFGAMIASTGKLTTLAHSQKYWWQAAYDDGNGRIFFDDRGFDESVEGYVLGIVVPIKYENQVIGILKSNINIIGSLTDLLQKHTIEKSQTARIVRTNGLIVLEEGVEPLTTQLSENFVEYLSQKEFGSAIVSENKNDQIFAFAPIEITLGSEEYGFGGDYESIDHIKGNTGEAWHIVITNDLSASIKSELESFRILIYFSIFLISLSALIAFLFGSLVSRPILKLEKHAMQDKLTGLYNRHGFLTLSEQQLKHSQRTGKNMLLAYADLNKLKVINDSPGGHDYGDQALIGASMILQKTFRSSDIIARVGGDEFAILNLEASEESIEMIKKRFYKVQADYNHNSKHDFQVSLSIGFALYNPDDPISLDELLKQADEMMYIDKKTHK